jgi:hypothetical protein
MKGIVEFANFVRTKLAKKGALTDKCPNFSCKKLQIIRTASPVSTCAPCGLVGTVPVHLTTILNLLVDFGNKCREYMDALTLDHVEVDEIWTFVRKKLAWLTINERAE